MFDHAYSSYLRHALPHDDLLPLTCSGKNSFGGYSASLIDALHTLAVVGNCTEFGRAVSWVASSVRFDTDIVVSVFETNIRIVGGLLAAHQIAGDPRMPCFLPGYQGELLALAVDAADRLLPAFRTPTGIPFGSINLRHGVPPGETPVTCTAGGGTFSLEFSLLSRLTGNPAYEQVARRAADALWERRSALDLVGNHINTATGQWTHKEAGIGSGIDSFYEYLLKSAVFTADTHAAHVFAQAFALVFSLSCSREIFVLFLFLQSSGSRVARQAGSMVR
eukprot:TRINITY_DN6645_c0_g1_i2.p1 TRINITY_DN6645_c0_g1~~TRINITY_DN6645_c0_g1_i2.p1  ORF type:complete len:317 (+),score=71.38 TRINITY_DN6645_c0_g1_i2:119-952(+)